MKKFLLSTLVGVLLAFSTIAHPGHNKQLVGYFSDSKESLIGATIKAIHQPTGTVYGSSSGIDGRFNIPNMRVGGPYVVVVSYIGYNSETFNDVQLNFCS